MDTHALDLKHDAASIVADAERRGIAPVHAVTGLAYEAVRAYADASGRTFPAASLAVRLTAAHNATAIDNASCECWPRSTCDACERRTLRVYARHGLTPLFAGNR